MDQPLILVIDDSQTIRKLVECHLSQAGYRVAMAADAEHGLELARTMQPQLILLDHQLPGTTGDEVCRKLLEDESTARIPVVISSAMRNRAYAQYTEYSNVVDQIPKPFTPELLKSGVANALQTGAMVVQAQRTGCAMPEAVGEVHDALLEGTTESFPLLAVLDFLNNHQQTGRLTLEVGKDRLRFALGGGRVQAVYSPTIRPDRLESQLPAELSDLGPLLALTTRRATGCVDGRAGQAAGTEPVRSQAASSPAEVPGGRLDLPGHDRRAGQVRIRAGDQSAADVPGLSRCSSAFRPWSSTARGSASPGSIRLIGRSSSSRARPLAAETPIGPAWLSP